MDFKFRVRRRLTVSLSHAHRALNRAAKKAACVDEAYAADLLPIDLVTFQNWSIRYLDFGFHARRLSAEETEIEVVAVVYLSRMPLARAYFESVVAPQLKDALYQFSLLSDVMAYDLDTTPANTLIDVDDLRLLAA